MPVVSAIIVARANCKESDNMICHAGLKHAHI